MIFTWGGSNRNCAVIFTVTEVAGEAAGLAIGVEEDVLDAEFAAMPNAAILLTIVPA
ncbi:MAG: hypothetical protein ACR2OU_02255 [Thermomicrobiales bacterium]